MEYLVKRARKGDADAFVALMEMNKESMKKVAFVYLQSEEDRADAISQTVLDAFEHISKLKKSEYFKTWLIRILINNCIDICRANKKYVNYEESAEVYDEMATQMQSEPIEVNIEFLDLLKCLPEDSRIIFVLYYGEQFTTAEIAKILCMKENTVKSRIRRGKEILRGVL